tara:strand:- start:833 stop:1102 length:270 start_codon:yes stop_codon:yes gene_type:complete
MRVIEILGEKQVWAKSGQKVVRKYRCSSGRRTGRVVASPAQCFAPIDVKKKLRMKKLKAQLGKKLSRKANRTKRVNPASKRVRSMNKGN